MIKDTAAAVQVRRIRNHRQYRRRMLNTKEIAAHRQLRWQNPFSHDNRLEHAAVKNVYRITIIQSGIAGGVATVERIIHFGIRRIRMTDAKLYRS